MQRLDRKFLASSLTCALLALPFAAPAADTIERRSLPDFPIASSVAVPGTARIVFVSGTLADVAKPEAPAGSVERLGDTETHASGLTLADVVKMNVFMVGDPAKGGGMDFGGLMKAYSRYFGAASQGNLPARTTVQVVALPVPGALVEIEVVAAR